MANRIIVVLAVVIALSGCAYVHRIDPVASGTDLEDLNRALSGRRVSVELMGSVANRHGATLHAESVLVAADSTSMTLLREPSDIEALWGEPSYGVRRDTTLSTSAIHRLSITRPGPGVVRGLRRGFLIGATVGAVVGAVSFKGPDLILDSRAVSAGFGAAILGVTGAGVGSIVGAIVGGPEVYDFAVTPPDSSGSVPSP